MTILSQQLADTYFADLLLHLARGQIDAIGYGERRSPRYDQFRIRCIPTAGGRQYVIKDVHGGVEGSGDYYELSTKGALELRLAVVQRALNAQAQIRRVRDFKNKLAGGNVRTTIASPKSFPVLIFYPIRDSEPNIFDLDTLDTVTSHIRNVADMTNPATGKTWREDNMALQHGIALESLVEVNNENSDHFGLRLWVVEHTRDCDKTPLYVLSFNKLHEYVRERHQGFTTGFLPGFAESNLTVIREAVPLHPWDDPEKNPVSFGAKPMRSTYTHRAGVVK